MSDNLLIKDNKLYEKKETPLFSYYNEIQVQESHPKLSWNAGKMRWDMWDDIKNICAYTYKEHKSECMIRFYFNQEHNDWKAVFMPQQMAGMTVKDQLCSETLIEEECTNGWIEAGSLHHHCSSGAFQSGTDEKDEESQIGLHITLGKMNADQYEIHSRFRTTDGFKDVNLMSFFEVPEWLESVPQHYKEKMLFNVMCDLALSPGDPDKAREDWIKRIVPKPKTSFTPYKYDTKYYRNQYTEMGAYVQDRFDLDTGTEADFRTYKDELEDTEEFYHNLYCDMACPLDGSNEEVALTTEQMLNLINKSSKEAQKANMELEWNTLREAISDARKTIKSVTLTGFCKYIKDNTQELEQAALETLADNVLQEEEESNDNANRLGKENHSVSII